MSVALKDSVIIPGVTDVLVNAVSIRYDKYNTKVCTKLFL